MKFKTILLIFFLLFSSTSFALTQGYLYILNDKCILELYDEAINHFNSTEISVIKDTRGIILRTEINSPANNINKLSSELYKKALIIEDFLAKIQKSAIIEVHVTEQGRKDGLPLNNWELSTIIANNIESVVLESRKRIEISKISSVGYGEFLPAKNTSNNGGKCSNRVDIILPCSISGE